MKKLISSLSLFVLFYTSSVYGGNTFPSFEIKPFNFTMPTNIPGGKIDLQYVKGTNHVHHFKGQIFTNLADGLLQTINDGYDGRPTDKLTPWKTMTEYLAVCQLGCEESKMRALYTTNSNGFLNSVYSDPKMFERYKLMATSIKSMTIIMGYEHDGGFIVWIKAVNIDNVTAVHAFYLVKSVDGKYFLESHADNAISTGNIRTHLHLKVHGY